MTGSLVSAITAVFTAILSWFIEAVGTVVSIFWVDGALTFLGVLVLMGLGIAVTLLVVNILISLMRFH